MSAPDAIVELVEKFERNKELYTNSKVFDEENTKTEFINPFFEALGWDVHNKKGATPKYKEVVFEDTIKISGKSKAPDYSFRLGGQRIFFVEAKKPSVNIDTDKNPAYQIRRYGWSTKLPLCILTDFEELAIYETTSRPDKNQTASIGRIKYYKYTDYVEKWDEISDVFSKESVLTGKFDNFVNGNEGIKKGTSEIDDEFLKEIDRWRLLLARNMALRNKELTIEELNFAVQLTIDRIIFLRMAEDRGIEKYQQLKDLIENSDKNKENSIYNGFIEICKKADAKYNSGLFHFTEEKEISLDADNITPNLLIDNKVFKDILEPMYYPDCPYEFSVISTEILGNVYERFLGKVIRLTPSHQAKVEEKPEVKKAGGVFYTPQYIVDYIVQNTIGELIKDKTPNQVSKMKFVDPACGSGSFLLGAYQYLLDWHLDYYSNLERTPKKLLLKSKDGYKEIHHDVIYTGKDGLTRLTINEKKRIVLNNIYGVDIDSQAVEVTKLSLLLKVLEDQNKDEVEQQQKLFQERALPYLGDNIRCGNSLIGTDILEQEDLTLEEVSKINPFDWETAFPEAFNDGGFDAVIGNPPYVRQERIKELKPYLKNHYLTYHGTADLYVYFFEKALTILKEKGFLSYISSLTFVKTGFGKKLRKFLLKYNIINFNNYENSNVFQGIAVKPCVIVINKSIPQKNSQILVQDEYKIYQKTLTEESWSFQKQEVLNLKDKILNKGTRIKDLEDLVINRGLVTGYNKAFIIDENIKKDYILRDEVNTEIIKPILNGKDIKKWNIKKNSDFILLSSKGINTKKYPIIKEHLSQFSEKLKKRNDKGDHWWELRACAYYDYFEEYKIIYPRISNKLFAVFDDKQYYLNATAFMINSKNKDLIFLKSLSVLFSSNVLNFIFIQISNHLMGGRFELRKIYIEQLPIIELSQEKKEELAMFSDKMLNLNKDLANCRTPKEKRLLETQIEITDNKINQLVYELYELSPEEIGIIEESLK